MGSVAEQQEAASVISARAFRAIGTFVVGGAVVLAVLTVMFAPIHRDQLIALGLLAAVVLANELARQKLYGDNFSSPSTIAGLAAGVLFGLPALAFLEAACMLIADITP